MEGGESLRESLVVSGQSAEAGIVTHPLLPATAKSFIELDQALVFVVSRLR
jgi:hypothetical protein